VCYYTVRIDRTNGTERGKKRFAVNTVYIESSERKLAEEVEAELLLFL
jgi:hypothetical protein